MFLTVPSPAQLPCTANNQPAGSPQPSPPDSRDGDNIPARRGLHGTDVIGSVGGLLPKFTDYLRAQDSPAGRGDCRHLTTARALLRGGCTVRHCVRHAEKW